MTPDQDLSARLAECHFCGTECTEIADFSKAEYPAPNFQVHCVACGFSGPLAPSEHDAAKLWNLIRSKHERAVQAAVAKAVEAERDACAKRIDNEVKVARMRGPQHVPVLTALAAAIRSRGVAG